MTRVIGIDQGLTGGIAYLEREPGGRVHRLAHAEFSTVKHCGRNEIDARSLGNSVAAMVTLFGKPDLVVAEKIQFRPGQGHATVIGCNFGIVRAVLQRVDAPMIEVEARRWQADILPGTRQGQTKAAAAKYAGKLMDLDLITPKRGKLPHSGICDAVCLAAWGLRQL